MIILSTSHKSKLKRKKEQIRKGGMMKRKKFSNFFLLHPANKDTRIGKKLDFLIILVDKFR